MSRISKKITSWSMSRYSTWLECPLKAKLKFIDKIPEPSNEAMERGTKIHKDAELYVNGSAKKISKDISKFKKELTDLRNRKASTELDIALDKNWRQCDWFAKEAWVRLKIDAAAMDDNEVLVIDYKTGKVSENYQDQTNLYKCGILSAYPKITIAKSQLWFIDHGVKMPDPPSESNRSNLKVMQNYWNKKVSPMMNDTRFAARPSSKCRWCHFRKSNGGPCEF